MFSFDSLKTRRTLSATAATLVLGLFGAGAAFADDSASLPAYGGPGGAEQGAVNQGAPGNGNEVLGTQQGGGQAPAEAPGGNEVLGARSGGGSLPSSQAPAGGTAPASATAPAAAHATHRLVGSLPFTGYDLVLVALVGVCLLALGLGLRRLSTSPQIAD